MKKKTQIDLNSDLKEEPELKNRCWSTLFGVICKDPEYG